MESLKEHYWRVLISSQECPFRFKTKTKHGSFLRCTVRDCIEVSKRPNPKTIKSEDIKCCYDCCPCKEEVK